MTQTVNPHAETVRIANIDAVSEKMEKIANEIADNEHKLHLGYVDIANKFAAIRSRDFDMRTMTKKVVSLQEEMSVLVDVFDGISEESTRRGEQ